MSTTLTSSVQEAEILESAIRESAGLPSKNLLLPKVVAILNEIPDDVTAIGPAQADYLAGKFLSGINICGELVALALGYELKMDALKKKEYSLAYHVRSASRNCKTIKDKENYPFMDETFIEAENKSAEAKIFRKYIEGKLDTLEKAHYHMRKIAEKDPVMGYTNSEILNKEDLAQIQKRSPSSTMATTYNFPPTFEEVEWE